MNGWLKRVMVIVVLAVAVLGYGWLIWQGPWLFDGDHLRQTDLQPADGVVITGFRTSLVALGAGAIAGVGLFYTHRSVQHSRAMLEHTQIKDREQAELTREGQVTDRYVEAIKLLSSDHLTQRLGGIYSLERIMRDSEKDHHTVVAVLSAFIRAERGPDSPQQAPVAGERPSPPDDVQAALTVLGRRPVADLEEARSRRAELQNADLGGANLVFAKLLGTDLRAAKLERANLFGAKLWGVDFAGADLRKADLHTADLREANLQGADLQGADLRGADFYYADLRGAFLQGADLSGARLRGATLYGAHLSGANLRNANLQDADLTGTTLDGTKLRGANLAEAKLQQADCLDTDSVLQALVYRSTTLPPAVASNAMVHARIEECEQARTEVPSAGRSDQPETH
ncbi:pentapeptide repeat-containing protein [Streptomyces sp. NRRL S-1831]|uniref:pentapeptide repeat-containing protein n=1 Tax=Streptomyces sp. NRRL S-1831 TaxID=1463890 RepID=UPI00056BB92C|nr:pentapeptide repeat-containing protein [Streptomyces sp. NRRL S-1831]